MTGTFGSGLFAHWLSRCRCVVSYEEKPISSAAGIHVGFHVAVNQADGMSLPQRGARHGAFGNNGLVKTKGRTNYPYRRNSAILAGN
jgi:hypothetical protein